MDRHGLNLSMAKAPIRTRSLVCRRAIRLAGGHPISMALS